MKRKLKPQVRKNTYYSTTSYHKESLNSDEEGIFTSVQEIFIKPKIEDHGKVIECKAVQLDGNNQPLYEMKSAPQAKLNVTFAPQEATNQTLKIKKGQNLTVTFVFKSNPMPNEITWVITIPKVVETFSKNEDLARSVLASIDTDDGTNSTEVVKLTPGHVGKCQFESIQFHA